jgi:hypothetical protein
MADQLPERAKRKAAENGSSYHGFLFLKFYSASEIAPVGHASSHAPQSTHVSASMTYFPSPSLIASTGHSPAQVPQLTQSSLITRAISNYLLEN